MDTSLLEMAGRIKNLRELMGFTVAEMAAFTGCTESDYIQYEDGKADITFTFLHKCSEKFKLDIVELMTGDAPRLKYYTVTRKGEGLPLNRREGFNYEHVSYRLKDKYAEPYVVTAPFKEEEQTASIRLSTHEGQEFDYILEGKLRVCMDGHIEELNKGDCVFYDSSKPHGMIAIGNAPCTFLAMLMKKK